MGRPRTPESAKMSLNRNAAVNKTPSRLPRESSHHQSKFPFHRSRAEENATGQATTNIAAAPGPGGPTRQNSIQTRYMNMLLAMDSIPRLHNILSSFFVWLLLAGFVIFPGTFTSIQELDKSSTVSSNQAASAILSSVKNLPLLIVAGVCCGIAACGMLWLWWTWRQNFVWLLNRIFLPGCLNSFAGLISTLINVYTQQDGNWSITAEVTAIVTGSCMVVLALLFALYNFWALERVKRSHGREMERETRRHGDETLGEKIERVAHKPALEPGSVV